MQAVVNDIELIHINKVYTVKFHVQKERSNDKIEDAMEDNFKKRTPTKYYVSMYLFTNVFYILKYDTFGKKFNQKVT